MSISVLPTKTLLDPFVCNETQELYQMVLELTGIHFLCISRHCCMGVRMMYGTAVITFMCYCMKYRKHFPLVVLLSTTGMTVLPFESCCPRVSVFICVHSDSRYKSSLLNNENQIKNVFLYITFFLIPCLTFMETRALFFWWHSRLSEWAIHESQPEL